LRVVCRWDYGAIGHVLRKLTQTTLRANPHPYTVCVILRPEYFRR
jgi:hypothetical protein